MTLAKEGFNTSACSADAPGVDRRGCLIALLSAVGLAGLPRRVLAGGQLEEPIADAVRNAMRAAVDGGAPPEPVFSSTESKLQYLRWKVAMNTRLVNRKSDLKTLRDRDEFLQSVWYNSKRAGLEIDLVLGLIQVESNFRKHAVSSAGARGYMQVMPFWTLVLGLGDPSMLFHMETNLRFGCEILRHYLEREDGDVFMALGRYNGSRGKSPYPKAVLAARRQWEYNTA